MMKVFNKLMRYALILYFTVAFGLRNAFGSRKKVNIGFLVEEFFHQDLGGFGGYGITVKNVTGFLNSSKNGLKADVLLTRMFDHSRLQVKRYYDTDVLFRPGNEIGRASCRERVYVLV